MYRCNISEQTEIFQFDKNSLYPCLIVLQICSGGTGCYMGAQSEKLIYVLVKSFIDSSKLQLSEKEDESNALVYHALVYRRSSGSILQCSTPDGMGYNLQVPG